MECILSVRHCAYHFTFIISVNPHTISMLWYKYYPHFILKKKEGQPKFDSVPSFNI